MGSVKGTVINVELSLATDLADMEKEFKDAMLKAGENKKVFEESKKALKATSDKAYNLAMKYKSQADDIGYDPMKNIAYNTIDKYFIAQTELLKG